MLAFAGYTMPSFCPLAERFAALYVLCRVQRGPRRARTLACTGLFEEHLRRLPEHTHTQKKTAMMAVVLFRAGNTITKRLFYFYSASTCVKVRRT